MKTEDEIRRHLKFTRFALDSAINAKREPSEGMEASCAILLWVLGEREDPPYLDWPELEKIIDAA